MIPANALSIDCTALPYTVRYLFTILHQIGIAVTLSIGLPSTVAGNMRCPRTLLRQALSKLATPDEVLIAELVILPQADLDQ